MLALLVLGLASTAVCAQDSAGPWYVRGDFQGLLSPFSGSVERDSLQNVGFFVRADYLETAGFSVGYNRTLLASKDSSQDIDQDNVFISGRWHMTPDWAAGQLTLRVDGYVISNNDTINGTSVDVIAPQVSYLNYKKTFYLDLGYARSSYDDSALAAGKLEVDQFTPTVGFGFNKQRDWLQARAYLIDPSSLQRAQGNADTAALEIKWTHWFTGKKPLGIDNFRASALVGERLFAVDPDAGLVYNLVDLQVGGASVGSEWALGERNKLLLLLGSEQYENQAINDDYSSRFVYVNFTHHWK